jgi:hypothetical protein
LGAFAAVVTLLLCACVEPAAEVRPDPSVHHALARRDGMSLSAATVALVSVEGAPSEIVQSFSSALGDAAKTREISIVDARAAHYLIRGYLSATATEDGAEVEYVWDVFGPDKKREFRLNDVMEAKGTGDSPWAVVTPAILASVAAKSADDLAAFLSRSPEAKPVAQTTSPAPALGYASSD